MKRVSPRRLVVLLLATAVAAATMMGGVLLGAPQQAAALSGSQFDPGFIISDANFFDGGAMSAGQIQSWLNSEESGCTTTSSATCLKDYHQTTRSYAADSYCKAYAGASNESAAAIIAKAGAACNVSQKAIIVTLQKEEGLVSAAQSAGRYQIAMGYACPDSAACDTTYYGFMNQVYHAARQFQIYRLNPGSFPRYEAGGTRSIQYNPNTGCGTKSVFVANAATAGLYDYTPYTPDQAALNNLNGVGDSCSSYGNLNFWYYYNLWFGPPSAGPNPFGSLDAVKNAYGQIYVAGWAIDAATKGPIHVDIYVDGKDVRRMTAGNSRPDVAKVYPAMGADHGFAGDVPATAGTHKVCVYGINAGSGSNQLIRCTTVTVQSGNPSGHLDTTKAGLGTITVGGWVLDPNGSGAKTGVSVHVDGKDIVHVAATQNRPDIARKFPAFGGAHGFTVTVDVGPGRHSVCVYGLNVGPGTNADFPCTTVTSGNGDPLGHLDVVTGGGNAVTVGGWAFDRSTKNPIDVAVLIDGTNAGHFLANGERSDIARKYPNEGGDHGFDAVAHAPTGRHQVCVVALNTAGGRNVQLGCQTVTIAAADPSGHLDTVTGGAGELTVGGWAMDPNSNASIKVAYTIDGTSAGTITASAARPDLAKLGQGTAHGFDVTATASTGSHTVCVTAENVGAGRNTSLGCRTVTVTDPDPYGNLDETTGVPGGVNVGGWAIDPNTPTSPSQVVVTVDGAKAATLTANGTRADVAKAHPGTGSNHGFSGTVAASTGSHKVCLTVTNSGPGKNLAFSCATVTVTNPNPFGAFDVVQPQGSGYLVRGWAIDPNAPTSSISVQVSVNGKVTTVVANTTRDDVAAAYPNTGDTHGYSTTAVPVAQGDNVCVTAVNVGAGSNVSLGCKTAPAP